MVAILKSILTVMLNFQIYYSLKVYSDNCYRFADTANQGMDTKQIEFSLVFSGHPCYCLSSKLPSAKYISLNFSYSMIYYYISLYVTIQQLRILKQVIRLN